MVFVIQFHLNVTENKTTRKIAQAAKRYLKKPNYHLQLAS